MNESHVCWLCKALRRLPAGQNQKDLLITMVYSRVCMNHSHQLIPAAVFPFIRTN